jgi:hypothetical protein
MCLASIFLFTTFCLVLRFQTSFQVACGFAPRRQDIYGNDELDAATRWWHTTYFVHTANIRQLAFR